MKRTLLALITLAPMPALAQSAGETTINPGSSGATTMGPGPQAPPPSEGSSGGGARGGGQAQPNVIVIGPDGRVTSGAQAPAENGYYVSGGQQLDPGDVHAGAVPDLHVVRSGDTLWDICFYYFNDPWQWPKVWSYNPQITNPHWIYPGDLVRLLPRGMFVQGPAEPAEPVSDTQPLPAPARKLQVSLKQTAFVSKADLDKSITIDGAVDEKALLGDGDSVYLSYPAGKPPQVGQRYSIYVPGSKSKQGEKVFGSYVRIIGTLEVVSVKQDKRARGVILNANEEIERGAKVAPLVKTYKNVPPRPAAVDAQGGIVGLLTRDQLIGDGEVVFIGLGKKSGIEVGNRMFVVRRGDALPDQMEAQVGKDDRRFPARALGEIVVVEVGETSSVGLVTLSVQEMSVGDIVMMQKSK